MSQNSNTISHHVSTSSSPIFTIFYSVKLSSPAVVRLNRTNMVATMLHHFSPTTVVHYLTFNTWSLGHAPNYQIISHEFYSITMFNRFPPLAALASSNTQVLILFTPGRDVQVLPSPNRKDVSWCTRTHVFLAQTPTPFVAGNPCSLDGLGLPTMKVWVSCIPYFHACKMLMWQCN
jgi:hypothetical protein